MSKPGFSVHSFNKMANFFLVVNDKVLTLIDTGSKDKIENIRRKFDQTGRRLENLKQAVPIHCHFDHV